MTAAVRFEVWLKSQRCAAGAYHNSPGLMQHQYWNNKSDVAVDVVHGPLPLCRTHLIEATTTPGETFRAKYGLEGASADYREIYDAQRRFDEQR